jgi:hypothetical protein
MAVQPYRKAGTNKHYLSPQKALPSDGLILREAEKVEDLLKKLLRSQSDMQNVWNIYIDQYQKLHGLNRFGKQVVIRMFRSNPAFQGFKTDFNDPILKLHVLFLLGTLCAEFDHMNTSPLYGFNVLDVGCGALSFHGTAKADSDLLSQFYSDNPPIAAELLQILGAQTIGIDPRANSKEIYDYQVSYKHRVMGFVDIKTWITALDRSFDVISCFNLFSKANFAYYYGSPEEVSSFLRGLKRGLSPEGLLYCDPPFLPCSAKNKQYNHDVFTWAGFQILHEGYYFILKPKQNKKDEG